VKSLRSGDGTTSTSLRLQTSSVKKSKIDPDLHITVMFSQQIVQTHGVVALIVGYSTHSSAPVAPPTPTEPTPIPPQAVWGPGSTGDKVRQIQGIVGVTQDGSYGPKTQAAVAVWQQNLRIGADGIWGPATEQATHDLFVFLSNLPAVQEVNPANEFFAALNDARSQVLRQGSTGGAVKIMQLSLNAKGFRLVGDGVFGPATDRALRAFQSSRGLAADGICGPRTWDALLA